jgi:histidinol-phosphate/aromatic aminotransferase/cobyric acid decarboxylase-like protein
MAALRGSMYVSAVKAYLRICLLLAFIVCLKGTRHIIRELYQFWGRRLHGQRVLFCVEVFEGYRISNEDVGELAGETSSSRDSLGLDALAHLELEPPRSVVLAFGDIHRHCL